jgi:hypothetical protein
MMRRWQYIFFPFTFFLLLALALLSRGVYDPGDGVLHHLFARYAFAHPENFLDHWAKPLYTLLSAPFAAFGYNGSVVFNLLCLCGSGWFAWKIAEGLKIPFAGWAAPLAIFAPVALPVGMSGLTEPLFALVLSGGIYAAVRGRFGFAAILISFLPFARTEGFFLAPLFGLFFLLKRDLVSTALLATGTVLYSVAGYFVHGDLLWIVHQNPYRGAEAIYGHGTPWHFIALNEFIWGWGLTLLLVFGIIFYLFSKKLRVLVSKQETLLVVVCFLVFLLLHSIFWWKGLFGSLGLHRVMAATMPLAAIIGLRGLQLLFFAVRKYVARIAVVVLLVGVQVFLTYRQHPLPFAEDRQQLVMNEAAAWMKGRKKVPAKINCAYPYMAMALEKDPFDDKQWSELWNLPARDSFQTGELIIWESHLAGDQGVTLEELKNDGRFTLLKQFGEIPAGKEERVGKFAVVVFEAK